MEGDDKEGYYCSVCGGIPPDKITTKRVLIDGKETGIDHLDWIFDEITRLPQDDDLILTEEIMKRVQEFNYVPTKKTGFTQLHSLPNTKKSGPDVHSGSGFRFRVSPIIS